eukprot:91886_1
MSQSPNNNGPNPEDNNNGNSSLKRTHSESQETDLLPQPPPVVITTNGQTEDEQNIAINPKIETEEPPLKRMKMSSPQIPHYNSHNIYHRPPAPPSSMPIPSLPSIVDPVLPSMLFNDDNNNDEDIYGASSAPLPESTEDWPLCEYCNKGGDLSRCSSCRQAYYCNRECQVGHWEVHSIICQPGPPQPPPQPPMGQPVEPPIIHHPPPQQPYDQYGPSQHPQALNGYAHNDAHQASPYQARATPRRRSYEPENVTKEQYYCEECDRYFKNGQALGGHRSRVHSSRRNNNNGDGPKRKPRASRGRYNATGTGQYVCPHCGREFASGNALGGHISGAHTKKIKTSKTCS